MQNVNKMAADLHEQERGLRSFGIVAVVDNGTNGTGMRQDMDVAVGKANPEYHVISRIQNLPWKKISLHNGFFVSLDLRYLSLCFHSSI